MTQTIKEARGFADAMMLMAEGMRGIPQMTYYRQMFAKASEVITELCDELSTGDASNELQKEKIEGEKEKRDLPPTPPIEKKSKEGEEKKDLYTIARTRVREEIIRINKEADVVFDSFWAKYPTGRKVAKRNCRDKLRRLYRDANDKAKFVNEFLGGLDSWLSSERWRKGIVCNPETWINQERWLCVPEQSDEAKREEAEAMREQSNAQSAAALRKLGL